MFKVIIVLLLAVVLTGCMDDIDIPTPQTTPAPAPAQIPPPAPADENDDASPLLLENPAPSPHPGGTLRLSMRAPSTLNPLLNEDATVANVLRLMFEPLVIFDENLRPIPHLASLEFASTGASVVVTIREDARWSDGEPVTSADLTHSIRTMQNAPPDAIYKRHAENFADVEVLDERAVRITFEMISGGAAYLFNFPIIPAHHNDDMAPVGNGPFMFDSLTESMRLVRNRYTFRGRPYISEVNVLITTDQETDLHAFDRGLVDIHKAPVPEWARHHSVKPVRFAEHLAMHYEFIGFNFDREIPRLIEFREALAFSFDARALISDIFLTHAMPAASPVHPASWLYEPDTFYRAYDTEAARALAARVLRAAQRDGLWPMLEAEAEAEEDEDGEYKEAEKRPLTVLVNEENAVRVLIARTVANRLNYIGLPAELVILPFDDFEQYLLDGSFDLFVGGYNLSLQPDLRFAFHSESDYNIISYNDPELDRLLEAAAVSGTDSGFLRNMSDIQIHMSRELPVISLAFRHSAVIADRRLQGDLRPGPDNIFINVHEWFISN